MVFLKRFLCSLIILDLIFSAAVYSQQPAGTTSPQVIMPLVQPRSTQQLTPQQQKAVQETIQPKELTPEAIETLKAKPEFQGLKPEDILKGKEELRKKEAQKKEPQKFPEKQVTYEEEAKSLFARYRIIGKYQDIPMDIKPFGYEFFRDAAGKVITDRKDVPVPSEYVVGTGDEVNILLWGRVNAQYNLIVDRNGNITIPHVGPIQVAGMTFEKMATHLIQQSGQIVGTNINVTMGALKSIPIFVLGDVRMPGAYTIGSFATITDALLIAGGPTDIGTMRNIELRRKDKVVTTFDLYELLLRGDKSKDRMLQAGDIVFVPVTEQIVGIAGNVKRPAIYELNDKKNLQNLFELAGGIIPTAYTQQIQIERIVKNERQIVIDINDKDLTKAKDFILQDGDLIKVFPIVEKSMNVIYLNGNVKMSGRYEYKAGMRVKDVIKDSTGLLKETYLDYALIKRLGLPTLEIELIPFNLGMVIFDNDKENNIELVSQDQIYIFPKQFFKDEPYVTIEGEVRKLALNKATQNKAESIEKRIKIEDMRLKLNDLKLKANELSVKDPSAYGKTILEIEKMELSIEEARTEAEKSSRGIEIPLIQNYRVKDAILEAGDLTKDASFKKGEIIRVAKGKEYKTIYFDVAKAMAGDPSENLILQNEDRIIIHSVWEEVYRKIVSIDGSVAKPGDYQLTEHMTIKDLIFKAGNVFESAYMDEAELTSQFLEKGKTVTLEHKKINLKKALQGDPEHNIFLRPYDRLTVKKLQDWGVEKFVNMSGEIVFPGKYKIKKGEKLSSIIERAGGYKESSYLRGAVFVRNSVKELQQKSLEEMVLRLERELLAESSVQVSTSLSQEEVQARKIELESKQKFVESMRKLKATGRMTIRLAHLRLLKGSEYDMELEDGDSLFIPVKNNVVNVSGAVMAHSSLVYSDKLDWKDYIEMSGSYSRYADKDNVYVLKVDGSARKLPTGMVNWNSFKTRWEMTAFGEEIKEIEAGDAIIVSEKLERIAWLREIKDITQIIMQMAVTAGMVLVLFP
ncbi:MAG: SLBB domain-containing protein [Thermodesulfovibrionales bacterium]|nr:SLBB domain-containing protein [Thermodesulfovibrionales bacterium]